LCTAVTVYVVVCPTMTGHHLEILPLSRHRRLVRYEGDVTPLAEHETQADALAEARNWAGSRAPPPDPTSARRPS